MPPAPPPPFYVITGGPGAGKTTLIEALAADGWPVVGESGRAVIRAEQTRGGTALPWADRLAFAAAMLAQDVAAFEAARSRRTPVLFDRGIPDVLGYLLLEGLAPPAAVHDAVARHRYAETVFVCPPWPGIYATDAERKQTPEIAERTCDVMRQVYGDLGYRLVEVPRAAVDDRVRFVRAAIGAA